MSTRVADVLRAALAAFGPNGENWTQGWRAKPEGPGPFEPPFCCIGTSFNRLTGTAIASKESGLQALEKALGVTTGCALVEWNDVNGRTFAEVKELFEKAIAAESAGGK